MSGGSVRAWPNLIWLDQDQKTCENFMKSAKEKAQMNSDEEVPRSGSTGCATLFTRPTISSQPFVLSSSVAARRPSFRS